MIDSSKHQHKIQFPEMYHHQQSSSYHSNHSDDMLDLPEEIYIRQSNSTYSHNVHDDEPRLEEERPFESRPTRSAPIMIAASSASATTTSSGRSPVSSPIPCPPPSRKDLLEEETVEDLKEVYNNSTWQMYHRIQNARKARFLARNDQPHSEGQRRVGLLQQALQ